MGKKIKLICPDYVSDFQCIGSDCEDSCCIGWDIDIDKLTFRQYFRTTNDHMKKQFVKHVRRNEDCDSEDVDYGRVRIDDSKWCPFLDEKKLCTIYSNLGEEYLSNVCYSYPRVVNILDNCYEMSLFMSCPEAIRKMMGNRDPIRFIEKEISLGKHIIHSYMDTKDRRWKGSSMSRLKSLRDKSIKMIQDRNLSIENRLLQLGYNLEGNFKGEKGHNHVTGNYPLQLGFFKEALNSLKIFSEIDSADFVEFTRLVLKGLKLDNGTTFIEVSKIYEHSINEIVNPFIDKNAYIFEHYLVNFMFQANFPFTENQNTFDGYMMLVVRFSFIRFFLAGIAAEKGALTSDDLTKMIQLYTKTIDHHKSFTLDLLRDMKEKELDNMEFISDLL